MIRHGLRNSVKALALTLLAATSVTAEEYLLGPLDVLSLRVVLWDENASTYMPMEALNGEYRVSPEGTISVPVLGIVPVEDRSPDELSAELATSLKETAGLYQPPTVSLQISQYRPFYVGGDVVRPGEFIWRPGLTSSKALALAGGTMRLSNGSDMDTVRDIASLRSVQVELARFLAREARLEAELAGLNSIEFRTDVSHPDGNASLERIFDEERAILEIRAESFERETESNKSLLALYHTELEGLEAKQAGHKTQMALLQEQADRIRQLAERGTVPLTRLDSIESSLLSQSAEELDLNTAIFRARQRIGETERAQLQLADNRQRDIVNQLQETRRSIELSTKRESMLMTLAATSGAMSPELRVGVTSRVRREKDGEVGVLEVGPDDAIYPGDMIEFSMDLAPISQ